jgi:hypothetical protein
MSLAVTEVASVAREHMLVPFEPKVSATTADS